MSSFGDAVRERLTERQESLRSLAKAVHYDVGLLSRVMNGKQRPSPPLAQVLDDYLCANGELTALLRNPEPGQSEELAHMREAVDRLLAHDNRHGGDQVADSAVQVWRSGQRKLDSGTVPEKQLKSYLACVAELAEVAGWLLFDSNRQTEARNAFLESQMLARHAGDKPLQWFSLDMLAMQDVQNGISGEALRIANETLEGTHVPPRVALLARVRQARALAQMGDRSRAVAAIATAQNALQDSIGPRDPEWSWWVNETEVIGHFGEVLLSLGDFDGAVPHLQRASELVGQWRPGGRGALYYGVAEVSAFASAGAWRDCADTLSRIEPILLDVTSTRSRSRLRQTVRTILRDPGAPRWLVEVARDVSEAA